MCSKIKTTFQDFPENKLNEIISSSIHDEKKVDMIGEIIRKFIIHQRVEMVISPISIEKVINFTNTIGDESLQLKIRHIASSIVLDTDTKDDSHIRYVLQIADTGDEHTQIVCIQELIARLVDKDDIDKALEIANAPHHTPSIKSGCLVAIVNVLCEKSQFFLAKTIAETIPDETLKAEALGTIEIG